MNGQLLYCPDCSHTDKPQVLGRLLDSGEFLILRFHSGTTLLHSDTYEITCGCGFTYEIAGTTIIGTVKIKI